MVERLAVNEMVPGSSPGSGGGRFGVLRPASVLNLIKIPDNIWDFDFWSSGSESAFCLIFGQSNQKSLQIFSFSSALIPFGIGLILKTLLLNSASTPFIFDTLM